MLTAVATVSVTDASVTVLIAADEGGEEEEAHEEVPENDLNPIFPEVKEIAWGFGSFIVFAVLLRYVFFPKLRKSMDARYFAIRAGHEQAEQTTDDAREAVAQYEAQLAAIRGEAQQRIEAARATLESERSEQLTAVTPASPRSGRRRPRRPSRHARPPRPTSSPPCGRWRHGPASWRPAGRPTRRPSTTRSPRS